MMNDLQYSLVDNVLHADDFLRLRKEVNFYSRTLEQAELAIRNGLFNVVAMSDGVAVGMGRLIGDGAMYWYLQDIAITPQYQGKGIGRAIVMHLIEYVKKTAIPGTQVMIGLSAAKGKDPFYEKLGFVSRPSETGGPGMQMMVNISR